MLTKQHLSIKNQTNDFFLKNLLKKTPYLIISYKHNTTESLKTITKYQICSSLSEIINKKTEKFPLSMNSFNNLNNLTSYINSKQHLIISLIKVKNILFKEKIKFKATNLNPTTNFTLLHANLIKNYLLFKAINSYIENNNKI